MRILIELPTWLGDTVMTTPAIENLVHHFSDVEITLIGSSASIDALKNHPNVHEVGLINKQFFSIFNFARSLGKFDKFFSFRSSWRSNLLKLFIRSNQKYQFSKTIYKKNHQVERYNDFINDCVSQNLPAKELIVYHGNTLSKNTLIKSVGLNPGASYGSAKRWYPEEYAKVAIELSQKYKIIIFGGPSEIDIASDIEKILIEKGVSNYQNLAGKTSIDELIILISSLSFFITGDSGPMHLAASFKIPTVAIFGPTNSLETSQWMNQKNYVVKTKLDCQPCMKRKCPLKHHNCMKLIKAQDVLAAIKNFN